MKIFIILLAFINISCGNFEMTLPKEKSVTSEDETIYIDFNDDARLVLMYSKEDEFLTYKSKSKKFALKWSNVESIEILSAKSSLNLLLINLRNGNRVELGYVELSTAELIKENIGSKTAVTMLNAE